MTRANVMTSLMVGVFGPSICCLWAARNALSMHQFRASSFGGSMVRKRWSCDIGVVDRCICMLSMLVMSLCCKQYKVGLVVAGVCVGGR